MNASASKSSHSGAKIVASNRKALHDYHVLDKLEAGVELRGTEVKSVRQGNINMQDGHVRIEKTGVPCMYGVHIHPYDHGNVHNHDPVRPRRLLLHRHEIKRLLGQTSVKGLSLIPLKAYFKRGKFKIEIGLCKGKQAEDKREDIKQKTAKREAARAMASYNRAR